MGIKLYEQPELKSPVLVACWPGLGNIGPIVGDVLVKQTQATALGEIESWDYFFPRRSTIRAGVLENMEFPGNKFYFKKLEQHDLIIFIGDEEPDYEEGAYRAGKKAFLLGNEVLDVATKFGCIRVYTTCAAITLSHHDFKSRVWGITSQPHLKQELRRYSESILMSESEGQHYSSIPGLKGLLAGLAKKRGIEAIILRGEIPDYLTQVPLPYPRAARSVLEALSTLLSITLDFAEIDGMVGHINEVIDKLLQDFPDDMKERIKERRKALQPKNETISQEDGNWLKQHLDDLFKKGGGEIE